VPTKRPTTEAPEEEWVSAREALIIAALVVLIVRTFVPLGGTILYPFTLFATWVHEMGHGITGLLVGGSFDSLEIFGNASGLAHGSVGPGWREALRAAGGLLGPPIVGALILSLGRGPKRAAIVLAVLAAVMLLSVPIWVRSLTGWIAIPIVAVLIGGLAYAGGPIVRTVGAQFLGVLLALDTLSRIDYLFTGSVRVGGADRPSDVAIIAAAIGLHYLIWGALLAAVSLVLLAIGVRLAWAKPMKLALPWRRRAAVGPVAPRSKE
jgi:hypothetical protein